MRRYALRDDQWERIEGLLPGREGHVGVTAKDNRLFVEAVLYRYRRSGGVPSRARRRPPVVVVKNGCNRHASTGAAVSWRTCWTGELSTVTSLPARRARRYRQNLNRMLKLGRP